MRVEHDALVTRAVGEPGTLLQRNQSIDTEGAKGNLVAQRGVEAGQRAPYVHGGVCECELPGCGVVRLLTNDLAVYELAAASVLPIGVTVGQGRINPGI